jgi:O-antigen/teichoic acid export membrane protein
MGLSTSVEPGGGEGAAVDAPHVVIKNSLANVITGVSSALLAVALPPVLARTLNAAEFGAWALILQLAGYTAMLNLGMQGAVGRYVSYYLAAGKRQSSDEFVSSAFAILCVIAVVALGGVVVASDFLARLFPELPTGLVWQAKLCLSVVGATLALGLPVTVFNGVFAGIQRNEIIALTLGSTRLLLTALLAVTAMTLHALLPLAIVFALVYLASYVATWMLYRRLAVARIARALVSRSALEEIARYCGSTMVWIIAMILISGADTAIVGRLDFSRVAAYAACLGPVAVIAGLQQALFSPLLQVGAARSAMGESERLNRTLLRATRLGTVMLLAPVATLLLFAPEILRIWLGPVYAQQVSVVFPLLISGHALRLVAMPYTTLLLATAEHRRVIIAPVVEGLANVTVAIVAGIRFGASGVACAVVVGAVIGQLLNYFYNLPRTHGTPGLRARLLRESICVPAACFAPAVLVFVAERTGVVLASSMILRGLVLLASAALAWKFAIESEERQTVMKYLRRPAFG